MPDILIDTSLAIDVLHGVSAARRCLATFARDHALRFHSVVVAELYEGVSNTKDYRAIDVLLVHGQRVVPSEHDLSLSLTLLRRYRPAHGVEWHDCLIAATALRHAATVATLNEKHFRVFKGLKVIRPY